jgi:single-stranded-DNA-specific exonuclease
MAETADQPDFHYAPRYEWQFPPDHPAPSWLVETVGLWGAQLLWQRGKVTPEAVQSFIDPDYYRPSSGWEFGAEMTAVVARLQRAHQQQETVIIWGDFDSDGITATAVLWEGLAPWFPQNERLHFYIPDRLQESHGLSVAGLDFLRREFPQSQLIITCDTGSSNHQEILYAASLGFEVIITDHHTLPPERPPVIGLINSRNFAADHPLHHLSGVAVAYKLIEVLYEIMPQTLAADCEASCEKLLDLVAIGLIADLVQLQGDCRYLAQKGLNLLTRSRALGKKMRPGLSALVDKCRMAGDRARDISYGIAPRINAASRMWGQVNDCVELLTTQNPQRAKALVERLEIANTERKDLQRQTRSEIEKRVKQLDLSTTGVILLADPDWSVGILGLVAGELVKEYQRPVILCTIDGELAKGSARAPAGVDLYSLLAGQENLLTKFGGHPLAGGLSFPLVHLPLLQEALNQNFWQQYQGLPQKELVIDLTVKLEDVTRDNAESLNQLEPYGMGNLPPNLRICRVIFQKIEFKPFYVKRKSVYGKSTRESSQKLNAGYIDFILSDPTSNHTVRGKSYQHQIVDLPLGLCDVVVNLTDFRDHEVILLDVMSCNTSVLPAMPNPDTLELPLLNLAEMLPVWDCRTTGQNPEPDLIAHQLTEPDYTWCRQCPTSWQKLHYWLKRGAQSRGLVLAYVLPHSDAMDHRQTWRLLVGIAKYLQRVGGVVSWQQISDKLAIDQPRLLVQGLQALWDYGYRMVITDQYGKTYDYVSQEQPVELPVEFSDPLEPDALEANPRIINKFDTSNLMEQNWQISCQGMLSQDLSSPLYHYPEISPNLELFWAGVTEYRFQQQFFDSQWQNYQEYGLKIENFQDSILTMTE